jgi:hypothetical protein
MGRARWAVAIALAATALAVSPAGAQQGDLNCDDFLFQEDAQAVYDADPSDPHGLDGPPGPSSSGVPGLACEDLTSRGSSAPTTVTTASPVTVPTAPGGVPCVPGLCTAAIDQAPPSATATPARAQRQLPRTGPDDTVTMWLLIAAGGLLFIGGNCVVASVDLQRRR